MPESKKDVEFKNRHEQIMKMIQNMDNYPRVLPVKPVRPTIPVSTGSLKLPKVLSTRPVRSASMGNSGVRPQTPYYNQQPSNMIRTGTPYPKKEEPRPVFSSGINKERTVEDLTKFFEKFINNNTRGGKYNKNKVGKKSKRVVKKANKK